MRQERNSSRRGVATVEMALVSMLLLTLLFAIIELGSVFYVRHNMVQAARNAARVMAVQDGTVAQAQAAASDVLANMSSVTFDVSIVAPAGSDDPNQDVSVTITAPLSEAAVGDPFNILDELTLETTVTMRKEG